MGSVNATSSTTDRNTLNTSYLQEPGRRIAGLTNDVKRQGFLQSEGSSLMIEGTDAAVTDYATYGSASGASALIGYKQELTDSTSGLIYLRSRYYQPFCGTFLTSDIESKENRYAYCNGDPTNLLDRDGWSAMAGTITGAVVGTALTVAVGVASGGMGAAIFGPGCVEASITAWSLAGATGKISGDATSAALQGRNFSAEEGIEDVVAGGVGGAVGTGVGGFAGSRAMSAASAGGISQRAVTITGCVTSGIVGGASGDFLSSAAMAEMNGQPVFSQETAIMYRHWHYWWPWRWRPSQRCLSWPGQLQDHPSASFSKRIVIDQFQQSNPLMWARQNRYTSWHLRLKQIKHSTNSRRTDGSTSPSPRI